VNEFYPIEISLDSDETLPTDRKLRIDLYSVATEKKLKENILDFEEPPIFSKEQTSITVKMRVIKAIGFDDDLFYLKIRGEYIPSTKTNHFAIVACYRVVLVGNAGVGKSELLEAYLQGEESQHAQKLDDEYVGKRLLGGERFKRPEIKVHLGESGEMLMSEIKYQVEVGRKTVQILLFDTCGDKKFRDHIFVLNQKTDFVLLCFSLIDYDSYDSLNEWKEKINKLAPQAAFAVVGLKKDIRDKRDLIAQESKKIF